MPKDTFLNLPDEKKKNIYSAALEEFANKSYEKVSITNIVNNSNISKGSFYQYFEDKADLYKYIMNNIAEEKQFYLNDVLDIQDDIDFFDFIRVLFEKGIEFAASNPNMSKIADRFMKSTPENIKYELMHDMSHKADNIFRPLIENAIMKKQLRSDIDIDFTSYMLTSVSRSVSEYYLYKSSGEDLDMSEILLLADQMLSVLKDGIKYKG